LTGVCLHTATASTWWLHCSFPTAVPSTHYTTLDTCSWTTTRHQSHTPSSHTPDHFQVAGGMLPALPPTAGGPLFICGRTALYHCLPHLTFCTHTAALFMPSPTTPRRTPFTHAARGQQAFARFTHSSPIATPSPLTLLPYPAWQLPPTTTACLFCSCHSGAVSPLRCVFTTLRWRMPSPYGTSPVLVHAAPDLMMQQHVYVIRC